MIILGIFLILSGSGSVIYGVNQNNNLVTQIRSIFSTGSVNPGTMFIIIGVIAVILGFIFIIAGLSNINKKNKNEPIVSININNERLPNNRDNYNYLNSISGLPVSRYERKTLSNSIGQIQGNFDYKQDFSEILLKNDLYDYIGLFKDNKLTSMSIVKDLNEQDLEKIGVSIMGDRKKILHLINNINLKSQEADFVIIDEKKEHLQNIATALKKPLLEKSIISHYPDIWNCPNCNFENSNNTYKCTGCGYSII